MRSNTFNAKVVLSNQYSEANYNYKQLTKTKIYCGTKRRIHVVRFTDMMRNYFCGANTYNTCYNRRRHWRLIGHTLRKADVFVRDARLTKPIQVN